MKKLLLTLLVLVAYVSGAWAQTQVIAKMQELVNAGTVLSGATVSDLYLTDVEGGAVYDFANGGFIQGISNSAIKEALGNKYVTVAAWVYGRPNGCIFSYGAQNDGLKFKINGTTMLTTTKSKADYISQSVDAIAADGWNLIAFTINPAFSQTRYISGHKGNFGYYYTKGRNGGSDGMNTPAEADQLFAIGSGNQGNAREEFTGSIANLTVIASDGWLTGQDLVANLVGAAPTFNVGRVAKNVNEILDGHIYTLRTKRNAITWNGSAANCVGAPLNENNPNHRFVAVKTRTDAGLFYFYNIGAQKFMSQSQSNATLTDIPNGYWKIKAGGNETYPLMMDAESRDHFNFGGSNQITVDWYSTPDDGNRFEFKDFGEADAEVIAAIKAAIAPKNSTAEKTYFYAIKNARSNKYANWTGDDTQMNQTETLSPSAFWYLKDGKLYNCATDKVYASINSFTEEGATVYVKENPYYPTYFCVSLKADLSGNCWDDNNGKVGNWNPRSNDCQGTSWTFEPIEIEPRTTSTEKYGTLCLPSDFVAYGAKLYTITNISDVTLELEEHEQGAAGVPYIYQAEADHQVFKQQNTNAVQAPKYSPYLQGSFQTAEEGLMEVLPDNYVLQTQWNEAAKKYVQAFYRVADGATIYCGTHKCYLKAQGGDSARKAFFFGEGEETAIDAVSALMSGKAQIYDLNGRKLDRLQKGINIIGGIKVVVK